MHLSLVDILKSSDVILEKSLKNEATILDIENRFKSILTHVYTFVQPFGKP